MVSRSIWLAGFPFEPVEPVKKGMLSDFSIRQANGLNLF